MSKHAKPSKQVDPVEPVETGEEAAAEGSAYKDKVERYIPGDRDREIYRQLFLLRRDPGGIAKRFGLSETTIRNVARLTRNALAERQFELSTRGEVDQLAEELLEVEASLDEAMQGWEKSQNPKITRQITQRKADKSDPVARVTTVEQCGQPRFLMAGSKLRAERRAVRALLRETKEREAREADPEAAAKKAALERLAYEREKNAEKRAEEKRRDDEIMAKIEAMSFSSTPEFKMLLRAAHEEDARRQRRHEKREAKKAAAAAAAASQPDASAREGVSSEAAVSTPAAPVTPVGPTTAPPAAAQPTPPVANAQGSLEDDDDDDDLGDEANDYMTPEEEAFWAGVDKRCDEMDALLKEIDPKYTPYDPNDPQFFDENIDNEDYRSPGDTKAK